MININELKVGSMVKCKVSNDAAYYTVLRIDGLMLRIMLDGARQGEWHTEDKLKPIKLTPEILESCGFIGEVWKDFKLPVLCEGQEITLTMCALSDGWALCMKGYSEQGVDEFEIADIFRDLKKEKYPNGIGISHKENFMALKNIKHLHQLQNLYFALTNEELKINL